MKFAGYDSIVFEGAADDPIYLLVEDDEVSIHDAKDMWGLDTRETTEKLKELHGKNHKVVCIGPSGEKLNRLAAILVTIVLQDEAAPGQSWGKKIKSDCR